MTLDLDKLDADPTEPEYATVARVVRAIATWTPNARRLLSREMGARFPDDANRTAHLLAVSERKRKAQRRELKRLNVHLAAARHVAANPFIWRDGAAVKASMVAYKAANDRLRTLVQDIESVLGVASGDREKLVEEVRKRCRTE